MIHCPRKVLSTCEDAGRVSDFGLTILCAIWKQQDVNENTYLLPPNNIDDNDSHSCHHY